MEKKCLYHWKEVPICVCLDVCTGKLNCTWADADLNCHNMTHCKHKDYGISKVWYGNSRKLSEVVDMNQNTENTTQSIDNSKMYCGYNQLYFGNYDCPYVDVNCVCTSKECCYRITARQKLQFDQDMQDLEDMRAEALYEEHMDKMRLELERLENRFRK